MTELDLQALEALCEGATPGPWTAERICEGYWTGSISCMDLIARARKALGDAP